MYLFIRYCIYSVMLLFATYFEQWTNEKRLKRQRLAVTSLNRQRFSYFFSFGSYILYSIYAFLFHCKRDTFIRANLAFNVLKTS